MFVYNIKIKHKKILKLIFILLLIIILILISTKIYTALNSDNNSNNDDIYTITSSNYTDILKMVHEDIDTYIGQKICFSGYVYRVYDLQDNEFVLARDMVVSSDFDTLVVGFLCTCENAQNFSNNTWVNITGSIEKGYYHGDIPVINITQIEEISEPSDVYVYPPDEYYIPTSSLLYSSL